VLAYRLVSKQFVCLHRVSGMVLCRVVSSAGDRAGQWRASGRPHLYGDGRCTSL